MCCESMVSLYMKYCMFLCRQVSYQQPFRSVTLRSCCHFVRYKRDCVQFHIPVAARRLTLQEYSQTSEYCYFPVRCFSTSCTQRDKSKLEDSLREKQKQKLSEIAEDNVLSDKQGCKELKTGFGVPEVKKPSLWSRFVLGVKHYYHGFRLLGLDVRIALRTLWKLLRGKPLVRRERNQFRKAVADIFRLAPFLVFIIIPFAEFALPVAVKLFPGMLPSTFETKSGREARLTKELKVKLEMAKFLQDTVEDIAVHTKEADKKSGAAQCFVEFFKKTRNADPTNEEILQYAKLFQDDLTLDNIGRPQLIALCRLIQVPAVGNNELLRFVLQMKLNRLHKDDEMIKEEGIDSLTTPELLAACQARGMRSLGVSRSRLKQQLTEWVDLHLDRDVPSSLLLLSRVLYLPDTVPAEERVKAAILTLPEKVADEAEVRAAELNLERVDNTTRYKAAKTENAEIVCEKERAKQERAAKELAVSDDKTILITGESLLRKGNEETISEGPVLTDTARTVCSDNKITQNEIDVIDDAIHQLKTTEITETKSELEELREDVKEYKEDVETLTAEIKHASVENELRDTKAGKLIQNRIQKMIKRMEAIIADLESSTEQCDDEAACEIAVLDLVKTMHSLTKLPEQKLLSIFGTLDVNKDGHIDVAEAGNVIKVLNQEDVEVTPQQLEEIVKLLAEELGNPKELEKVKDESKKNNPNKDSLGK